MCFLPAETNFNGHVSPFPQYLQSEDNFRALMLKGNILLDIKTQNAVGFPLQNIGKVFQKYSEFSYYFLPLGIKKKKKERNHHTFIKMEHV